MGCMQRRHRTAGALALALTAVLAAGGPPALAFDGARGGAAAGAGPAAERPAAAVRPFRVRAWSSVASGGVALRNRPGGGIDIAGPTGAAVEAWLYWAVITDGPPPEAAALMRLQRTLPTRLGPRTLTGSVVGTGASPCWHGDRITVYRARVPVTLASGNGSYLVTLPEGVPGTTDGRDPWAGSPLPAYEGASLILIRDGGASTVALYDSGFAGLSFLADIGLAVVLALPAAIADSGLPMTMHLVGADGQDGFDGLSNLPALSGEMTAVNGVLVGGPGSPRNDSDWNGSAGQPLTKLWDNRAADVTHGKLPGGRRMALTVGQPGGTDCLTAVAVAIQG